MVASDDGWVGPEDFQEFVIPDQAIIIADEPDNEPPVNAIQEAGDSYEK